VLWLVGEDYRKHLDSEKEGREEGQRKREVQMCENAASLWGGYDE